MSSRDKLVAKLQAKGVWDEEMEGVLDAAMEGQQLRVTDTYMEAGLSAAHGAVGTGIPNVYPVAIGPALDRMYLRPTPEPLFDAEIYDFYEMSKRFDKAGSNELVFNFFQKPISQSFCYVDEVKTEEDTNLNQSSMLDYPREFSILGFNVYFIGGTPADREAMRESGFFEFTFAGRRPYLRIPLAMMPRHDGIFDTAKIIRERPDKIKNAKDTLDWVDSEEGRQKLMMDLRTMYPYVIDDSEGLARVQPGETFEKTEDVSAGRKSVEHKGTALMRVMPGEAFGVRLKWKVPPRALNRIKMYVAIEGRLWVPL